MRLCIENDVNLNVARFARKNETFFIFFIQDDYVITKIFIAEQECCEIQENDYYKWYLC